MLSVMNAKNNESNNFIKMGIPVLAMLGIITVMIGFSRILGEKEIIFPEIAALSAGLFLAPKRSWQVSGARMILFISVCAVCGVAIVRYVPLPLVGQMILAFAVCQVILGFSRTTFAPMISAMVLPVLLQTDQWIYPVAAAGLTALIVLVYRLLVRAGVCRAEAYEPVPVPDRFGWRDAGKRVLLAAALMAVFLSAGWQFCVAPPLLVAFQEFSNPRSRARAVPVKTVAVITACAGIGAYGRLFLTETAGMPLTLTAVLVSAGTAAVILGMKLYLPPAGALAILPMLLSSGALALYPVMVLAGVSVMMLLARLFFHTEDGAEASASAYWKTHAAQDGISSGTY
jgi:hypothetical protein